MALWMEQFDSSSDLGSASEPREVWCRYVICSTQRCGSHFLGRLLKSTGQCGDPLEYFNPLNLPHWEARRDAESEGLLLPFLERIRASQNGCFGTKVHFDQLTAMEAHVPLEALLADWKLIRIRRRGLLDQAISYAKAVQTGSFVSAVEESGEAKYDRALILECMASVAAQNASWDLFFASTGVPVHDVWYEELRAAPAQQIASVGEFLGLPLEACADQSLGIRSQADARNEEWAERFRAESRAGEVDSTAYHVLRAARRSFAKRIKGRLRRILGLD